MISVLWFLVVSLPLNVVEGILWFGHGQKYLFECRLINGIATFYGFFLSFWTQDWVVFDQKYYIWIETDLIGMTCLSFSSCSNISAREVSRAAINLIEPFNRYQRTVRDWPLYWLLKPSAKVRPRIPALKFIFHSESRNHFHCQIVNFVYIFITNLNFQCWSLPEFWFEMLLAEFFF